MSTWTDAIPYFDRHELDCKGTRHLNEDGNPIPGTGVIELDIRFAVAFPHLRVEWGGPLHPNSVCRTPEHNAQINNGKGGHPRSMHLTQNPKHPTSGTMGADVAWRDWSTETKLKFARLAWSLGWSIGLHDGFCHVDRRADVGLNQGVFLYGTWSGEFDPEDVIK